MTRPLQQTKIGCSVRGAEHFELDAPGADVGVEVMRARIPPGFRILRLPKFGRGSSEESVLAAVRGLRELAETEPVLRAHVEVWSERAEDRDRVARVCAEEHFTPAATPRMYRETLWIDLDLEEEDLLASFHATARRHIRTPGRRGFPTIPVTDPRYAPRLKQLHLESFRRSGGEAPHVDWPQVLAAARTHPDRVAIRGIVEGNGSLPGLVSFAAAVRNDDVAEYLHAGCSRRPDLRIPLLYAPTWELMRWARSHGATSWDFGGITPGSADDDDPRGGISDFKRYFGGRVVEVGGEWVYEPAGVASGLARAVSRVKSRLLTRDAN
ncbi:MAG TPA: peptidoglycan bridge formation glycyltransferase FemA/FemB family protein [Longimicrobiales bacterium]|nr:peptidoglycan bridge formation glycyltransferase FemA/FemB family protein [Longimicrobiales bacterium]